MAYLPAQLEQLSECPANYLAAVTPRLVAYAEEMESRGNLNEAIKAFELAAAWNPQQRLSFQERAQSLRESSSGLTQLK